MPHCDFGQLTKINHPLKPPAKTPNALDHENEVKVWDIFVRFFHWALVTLFFLAYASGDDFETVHAYLGYGIVLLLVARIIWGLTGTKYARFTNFIYGRKTIKAYAGSLLSGRPKHYLGHNPLGGWMIMALLAGLLLTCWSGLEAYGSKGLGPLAAIDTSLIVAARADDDERVSKGSRIWKEIHEFFASLVMFLIAGHIAGVIISSLVHRENLVRSMWTGYKINPHDDDVST